MSLKKVVGASSVGESWVPHMKESGLEFFAVKDAEEAKRATPDFVLIDARDPNWLRDLPQLKQSLKVPILTLISNSVSQKDLSRLRSQGVESIISSDLPGEEFIIRILAMLEGREKKTSQESRAAHRVWFQKPVEFKAFDRRHSAWSTTLSETGIFLHTPLTLPLYSTIRMKFSLFDDQKPFECDGVIVRQEVDGLIPGLGVMFQNLRGENIEALEAFLEIYSK